MAMSEVSERCKWPIRMYLDWTTEYKQKFKEIQRNIKQYIHFLKSDNLIAEISPFPRRTQMANKVKFI